jgi:hypothetical protein
MLPDTTGSRDGGVLQASISCQDKSRRSENLWSHLMLKESDRAPTMAKEGFGAMPGWRLATRQMKPWGSKGRGSRRSLVLLEGFFFVSGPDRADRAADKNITRNTTETSRRTSTTKEGQERLFRGGLCLFQGVTLCLRLCGHCPPVVGPGAGVPGPRSSHGRIHHSDWFWLGRITAVRLCLPSLGHDYDLRGCDAVTLR